MKKSSLIFASSIVLFSFIFVMPVQASNFSAYVYFADSCPVNHALIRVFFLNGTQIGMCAWTDKFGWCYSPYFEFANSTWYRARAYYPTGNTTEMGVSMFKTDNNSNAVFAIAADQNCASGHCIDGFCCNSACSGTCQACNLTGSEGNCTNIPNGLDPAKECSLNNISGISTCDNIPDDWHYTWDSRNPFTSTCNGAGACTTGDATIAHTCSKTSCSAPCESSSDCSNQCNGKQWYSTYSCNGQCSCDLSNPVCSVGYCGAECDSNDDCPSNICKSDCTCEPKTCGISATDISFGSLGVGDTSSDQTSTLTNTGNSPTDTLAIKGNDWTGTPSGSMVVGQTHWSLTSGQNYNSMTTLTTSDASLGQQVSPGTPLSVYFKLAIPNGQAAASYSQTITFTGSC